MKTLPSQLPVTGPQSGVTRPLRRILATTAAFWLGPPGPNPPLGDARIVAPARLRQPARVPGALVPSR